MNIISLVREALKGYKTYIVGCLMIGIGVYTKDSVLVLEGLGLITLRAGISKTQE